MRIEGPNSTYNVRSWVEAYIPRLAKSEYALGEVMRENLTTASVQDVVDLSGEVITIIRDGHALAEEAALAIGKTLDDVESSYGRRVSVYGR